jgi:hypothetical protein
MINILMIAVFYIATTSTLPAQQYPELQMPKLRNKKDMHIIPKKQ